MIGLFGLSTGSSYLSYLRSKCVVLNFSCLGEGILVKTLINRRLLFIPAHLINEAVFSEMKN